MVIGEAVGPYTVVAKLGEGGMGEVYRARDTRLDRDVALKILPESFAADPERLARFEREAKTLASLNHPHIAQIYGVEETPARSRALVMELVEGEDLSQRIARGAIPIDEALPIARQIAAALEAAHDLGIIHRDLKPANVKLRPDGTVKVLDFGLAKALDRSDVSARITSPREFADDHHAGHDAGRHDPRHGCLHEPRTGEGQGGRSAHRSLGVWLRALRDAHRQARVRRRRCHRYVDGDLSRRAAVVRIARRHAGVSAAAVAPLLAEGSRAPSRFGGDGSNRARRAHCSRPVSRSANDVTASPWLWVLGATTIASLIVAGFALTRPVPRAGRAGGSLQRSAASQPEFSEFLLEARVSCSRPMAGTSSTPAALKTPSSAAGSMARISKYSRRPAPRHFSLPIRSGWRFSPTARLKKMPVDGGLTTTICNTDIGRGTWGDDGSIVFVTARRTVSGRGVAVALPSGWASADLTKNLQVSTTRVPARVAGRCRCDPDRRQRPHSGTDTC